MLGISWSEIWQSLKDILHDAWIASVNFVITVIAALIDLGASVLPSWDPIGSLTMPPGASEALSGFNWFFPVGFAINMVEVLIWSTIAYFTIGIITRWAKVSA